MSTSTSVITLHPRPLQNASGAIALLPLLPLPRQLKPLPAEIWLNIFEHATQKVSRVEQRIDRDYVVACNLVLVNKAFKSLAEPLMYSKIELENINRLQVFTSHLHGKEQKWDSIRRHMYSAPGRWVQTFDLSRFPILSLADSFAADELLTNLFPLLPCLSKLILCPTMSLSRRTFMRLVERERAVPLRALYGAKIKSSAAWKFTDIDSPLLAFLRQSPELEELEVLGTGLADVNFVQRSDQPSADEIRPLHLSYLRKLTLLSLPCSPTLHALLHSPLPSLRSLTITPYEDIPAPTSLVSEFITTHGTKLRTLQLFTPKSWPSSLRLSSPAILHSCPALTHLSLERPLPNLYSPLAPNPDSEDQLGRQPGPHPLTILSIPTLEADFLRRLETILPALPHLSAIRARDVKWLRKGLSSHAQEAGVQGVMRLWRRKFSSRGIEIYDADWKALHET